jgi:hypothetical protein
MPRIPLLAGSRVAVVDAADDAVVLRPPPPGEAIVDVGAAVRDALRFPLAGEPLEVLATRGGRATIVVEPPTLPIPSAARDPREAAIGAAVDELARAGVPPERQTILVAGGLARRAGQHELEALVAPGFARRYRGRVAVHDAESPDLVALGTSRIAAELVDTDLVLVVSAAESVLHGGAAALLGASDPRTLLSAEADSLLETGSSLGWHAAVELERALAGRTPVLGVSLALNHPTFTGALHGYPYDAQALERIAASPLRRLYGALPAAVRARVLQSLRCELTAAAVFAGPPSVAHAEALLRGIEARRVELDEPLDAIVLGIPRATPHLPRERPNPVLAAALGLGLALRLWRDAFPVRAGGTAILLNRFERRFAHPTQTPYRSFMAATRFGREPGELAEARQAASGDARAVEAYRSGRSAHPLLPYADWAACAPALDRLGAVVVAGCRDAAAARSLGLVPAHNVSVALEMARGRGAERIGFLLSPPYFPLVVGSG